MWRIWGFVAGGLGEVLCEVSDVPAKLAGRAGSDLPCSMVLRLFASAKSAIACRLGSWMVLAV